MSWLSLISLCAFVYCAYRAIKGKKWEQSNGYEVFFGARNYIIVGGIKVEKKCCEDCLYFNGGPDDEYDFCDEKEQYVSRNNYCPKYKSLVDEYARRYEERWLITD